MKKKRTIIPCISPSLIVYERLGQTCIRRRPSHVANPNTKNQKQQRQRFALAVAAAKQYADQLTPEWHEYARLNHKTGLNLLIGHIMRHALTTDTRTGNLTVDHSKIDLRSPWK